MGAQGAQVGLERGLDAVQPTGVDESVVGQRHCRDPAFGDAGQHHRPHQLGGAVPVPARSPVT